LPLPPLPKEIQLILACARPSPDDAQAARIRQLVASVLDWDRLLNVASYHGMLPLLYHNLKKTAPEAVPPAFSCELQKRYLINARRCTLLTRELSQLLDIFEANGIAAIPFKGPALARVLKAKWI
jgi:hypothetical protein